jgi:hypothetical protein
VVGPVELYSTMPTILNVSILYRAHSSGSGEPHIKSFSTLEKASNYLIAEFHAYLQDLYYPEEWDSETMFVDETCETPAPAPNGEMALTLFSVDALKTFLADKKRYGAMIYGPYSEFEVQIPVEFNLYVTELD